MKYKLSLCLITVIALAVVYSIIYVHDEPVIIDPNKKGYFR